MTNILYFDLQANMSAVSCNRCNC